ncbi:AAA family ATPase [Streptomyces sp. NPDC005438]|uniref:helix-turn-helix transcriptional regulator n=1 Tax=Streptomyces sp. NPDC005438 TaxID=3156880 RepID=UPI0033B55562
MSNSVVNNLISPVFVGRARELRQLTGVLEQAGEGRPQAVLLGGEAGVGKTRLLEEFLTAARAAGALTAVGGCVELGADGLPFAPFATALRALRHALTVEELTEALAGRETELARLLPDLAIGEDGAVADPSEEEDGRARLFELTAQLLERLARERTIVLAIEDLHWADRSTRELLGYLNRSLQNARIVLLGTYRSDDIHRRHPLRPFLAEQDRLRVVRRIELGRLAREEVHAQVAGIQGVARAERELAERVFARSEGNPFLVEELTTNGGDCGISESLRDLLLVRVEALPEPAQRVVQIAALGGSTVEYGLLDAVCGLPQDERSAALRAAVNAHVLLPTEDGTGYRFRHALLREAVSEDLLPGEAVRLNRAYAQALEAEPALVRGEERATRLAHYWYYGRDAAKALPAVLRAATQARRRHAFAEQHQLLERALDLWEEVPEDVRVDLPPMEHEIFPPSAHGDRPDPGALDAADLLAETVVAARTSGDLERALLVARRALDQLDDAREPLRAAWFWVQRSRLTEELGKGDGREELRRAERLVAGWPPAAVHAEVLSAVAAWVMLRQPGPEALRTAEQAVELAQLVDATTVELQARTTLGTLMLQSGDVDGGLAEMAKSRERAEECRAYGVMVRADINISSGLETAGRSTEAVEAAARAERGAAEHGRADFRAFALANQAESELARGNWAESARLLDRAGGLARSPASRGRVLIISASLASLRGDLDALQAATEEARRTLGNRLGPPQNAIPVRYLELSLAAGRNETVRVRELLDACLDEGFAPGTYPYAWRLLYNAAAHEARVRDLPTARHGRAAILERLGTAARRLPHPAPVWEGYSRLVRAELDLAEGRDSAEGWAFAAAAFEPLERPVELAQTRGRWAQSLLTGTPGPEEREKAAELLVRAWECARRLGADELRAEIERLAERAGIVVSSSAPQPPAPKRDPFGLTSRERDVLRLVAAGHSNRRIAQELFISPKTASVHVSRILAKLGVSGRGEAAAMAHRLRLVPEVEPGR